MSNYKYTIKQLLKVKQFFDDHPEGQLKIPFFPEQIMNKAEWHKWFSDCLNDKINSHLNQSGRKYDNDWFMEIWRFSRLVNNNMVIHWVPPDLRTRFSLTDEL